MKRALASIVVSLFVTAGLGTGVAQAAHHYANCTALHRDHRHGVAKSRRAARREVADGYGYPFVSLRLYNANSDLDANHDGVACEA
jgi:hypothetical protein